MSMSTVNTCALYSTSTNDWLATYFAIDAEHQRMADYLVGAASWFNIQGQLMLGLADMENAPGNNWVRLGSAALSDFQGWYNSYNVTGEATPTTTDIQNCDSLNAAAGAYWLTNESRCSGSTYTDYRLALDKLSQYNGLCPSCTSCPYDTAYAWSVLFLAYGSAYTVGSITFGGADYPVSPTGSTAPRYNPDNGTGTCGNPSTLTVPSSTVQYQTRSTTYGTNDYGKQVVVLAGETTAYVSALQVGWDMYFQIGRNTNVGHWVPPMATSANNFAARITQNPSTNMVIALGSAAKTNLENACSTLGLSCYAYSSYSTWVGQASGPGFVDCSTGSTDQQKYQCAHDNAFTAAENGNY